MGEESADLNLILSPPSPPPQLGLALGLSSRTPFPNNDGDSQMATGNPRWFQLLNPAAYLEPQFIPPADGASAAVSVSEEENGGHLYSASRRGASGSHRLRRHSRRIRMPPSEEEEEAAATAEKQEMVDKLAEVSNSAANFECNICLDVACEPVVTVCGHLFCWPCIYQWLHCYSTSKECPVCKGEVVTDKNLIPIYGRGVNLKIPKISNPNLNEDALPPRPRARRMESWRQRESEREGVLLPLSRRLEELIRLRNSRRGLFARSNNENGNPRQNESIHDLVMAATDRIVTRLRAVRRLQNEEGFDETWAFRERVLGRRYRHQIESRTAHPESSEVIDAISYPESSENINATADNVEGLRLQSFTMEDLNPTLQRADRLAIRSRLASMEGMLPTLASINTSTPTPSALNSNSLEPLGSATALVIPGSEVGMTRRPAFAIGVIESEFVNGEALLEPVDSTTSSIPFQSRRDIHTAGASASADVDEGLLPARKTRRLN